jgi:hypothetical protein
MEEEVVYTFKEVLEIGYHISGILLIITVIIGVIQLWLMKKDLSGKYKRASVEKSIEYLDMFASDFIPKLSEYQKKYNDALSKLNQQLTEEGKPQLKEIPSIEIPLEDYFIVETEPSHDIIINVILMNKCGADELLNRLEYFSAAMLSGLADEKLAYNPLSDLYCSLIDELYHNICMSRGRNKNSKLYTNVIALYKKWKNRIIRSELEQNKKTINDKLSKTTDDKPVRSIGL